MSNYREENIKAIIEECFWGEYSVSVENIIDRLDKKDPAFIKFLFSKIVENSRYPSHHIKKLFPPALYVSLIADYLQKTGGKKRVRLISANLTGEHEKASEYKWQS
jgi:hypothetical protein